MNLYRRRSDIAKLVTRSREVWRQSVKYQAIKRECKDPDRTGWFICRLCGQSREVIVVDHIVAIGKQPDSFLEFGTWLDRLFNLPQMGICRDCDRKKSKKNGKNKGEKHESA